MSNVRWQCRPSVRSIISANLTCVSSWWKVIRLSHGVRSSKQSQKHLRKVLKEWQHIRILVPLPTRPRTCSTQLSDATSPKVLWIGIGYRQLPPARRCMRETQVLKPRSPVSAAWGTCLPRSSQAAQTFEATKSSKRWRTIESNHWSWDFLGKNT